MTQYIDKNALIAEIKSRINDIEVTQKAGMIKKYDANKKISLFKSVLSLIDTLEVKEFDWQSFRDQAAKDILCAVLPRIEITDGENFQQSIENIITNSINTADEIIKQLKEKEEEK